MLGAWKDNLTGEQLDQRWTSLYLKGEDETNTIIVIHNDDNGNYDNVG